jgi:hypothetical protein
MKRRSKLIGPALALALTAGGSKADIVLVQDGAPKATIVVAAEALNAPTDPTTATFWYPQPASNKIAAAARDLQVYIEKMSGAKLPIVGDTAAPQGALILVGRSALTKDFDSDIPSGMTPTREEEGYLMLAKGERLLLAGNDAPVYHGTEYAVGAFLHLLGVRWYMPGDFGDFVPRQKTIAIKRLDVLSRPDFKMRNWWGPMAPDLGLQERRWKIRNGMNPILHFVTLPADSSVRAVLPPASEVTNAAFADVWGRREDGRPNDGMPNLTSEKSVQYAAEKVKEHFRKAREPWDTSHGIGGDDGYPRDYSPGTLKRNLGFPDVGGRVSVAADMSTTEEWMEWIQAVAQEVNKEFPNHILTSNGYANRNVPPIGVTPDPKIWIMFAAIWCDTMHAYDNPRSWMTLRQGKMIERWASMYKNVYMYNYLYYMLAGCGAPIPLAHKHMHDMPLYKKWGVVGFSDEGRTIRGESGVFPTYLRARMMWNADLDAKAEMEEFFANWYGPAKAPAMAFWEELENTFETTPWLGHEDRILPYVYSPELVAKLEQHLKQAETLATDAWSKPRVLADRVVLEHLKAFMAMSRAEFDADFTEAANQAQRMVDVRKDATALSRFYFAPNPQNGESVGYYYWGSVARRDYYRSIAEMTVGTNGQMIVVLPERAKFRTDPRDEGRYFGWYDPEWKDADWESILTTMPYYRQGKDCVDQQGYPYLGAIWYRMQVDVPRSARDKKVCLYLPAIEPEAWVWVNGQFIGHRPYRETYERPNQLDMDVTKAVKPGRKNLVAIRVHTSLNAAAMPDGMVSRAFIYAPKAQK